MTALALLLSPAASAAALHLDRVELVSTDPGTWLNWDVPAARTHGLPVALRFVEQVQPVVALPVDGLHLGLSLASWSLSYERPFGATAFGWAGGVQTRLALPAGVFGELTADAGPMRFGLGASLLSHAKWARLSGYGQWDLMPGVTIGVLTGEGRRRATPTP